MPSRRYDHRYADEYEDEDDRPRKRGRGRRRDDDDDRYADLEPHRGMLVLILGALSLAVTPLIGPFAWWMGATDLRKMRAGVMDPRGKGETHAGYVLGIIATVLLGIALLAIAVVLLMVLFGVFAAAGAVGAAGAR